MPTDHELQATSRRLTATLFIGQRLALVALFTTVAISSLQTLLLKLLLVLRRGVGGRRRRMLLAA